MRNPEFFLTARFAQAHQLESRRFSEFRAASEALVTASFSMSAGVHERCGFLHAVGAAVHADIN